MNRTLDKFEKFSGEKVSVEKTILLVNPERIPFGLRFPVKTEERYLGVWMRFDGRTTVTPEAIQQYTGN